MTTSSDASTDTQEVERVVADRLATIEHFTLATCGADGPWAASAFFVARDTFTLELVLEQSGRTLRNLQHDPRVGLVVSAGTAFEPFLQAQAEAEVVTGDDDAAIRAALVAKVPAAEGFMAAPIVAVRLHVGSWRATDVVKGWLPGKVLTREG